MPIPHQALFVFSLPCIRTLARALAAGAVTALLAPAASQAVVKGSEEGSAYVNPAPNDGYYPWTVAVVAQGMPAIDGQFCGGTLIARDRVLTAAHCIDPNGAHQATPSSIEVLVGQTSLAAGGCTVSPSRPCSSTDHPDWKKGVRLAVSGISLHSLADVDKGYFRYDLAQLILKDPIPESLESAIVAPVDSSGENQTDAGNVPGSDTPLSVGGIAATPDAWAAGTSAFVFGWGVNRGKASPYYVSTDEQDQQVITSQYATAMLTKGGGVSPSTGPMMERLSDDDCTQRLYPDFRATDMLCVGRPASKNPGPDACYGDSGGPLLRASYASTDPLLTMGQRIELLNTQGRHWRLMGVVSWGSGCGVQRLPGAYARVGAPALRSYVLNPSPPVMPKPSDEQGPSISGYLGVGEPVSCDAGAWTGATSFSFTLWRDVNGDGGRGLGENAIPGGVVTSDGHYQAKLTTSDVTTLAPQGTWIPKIGCTVTGRGPGGYFTRETTHALPKAPTPGGGEPTAPPATTPLPTTPGPDVERPTLNKSSVVCSTTGCRVAVIILDPGKGALGVKRVEVTLVITRVTRKRITSGKDKGRIRTTTKTYKKNVGATRSGDQWIVRLKRLRATDRHKLKVRATDAAGNVGTLTVGVKLRKK